MTRRIYVKLHITMSHIKYRTFGSCGFSEDFSVARLAGFIKRTTIQNMKGLGHVVSKTIFMPPTSKKLKVHIGLGLSVQ